MIGSFDTAKTQSGPKQVQHRILRRQPLLRLRCRHLLRSLPNPVPCKNGVVEWFIQRAVRIVIGVSWVESSVLSGLLSGNALPVGVATCTWSGAMHIHVVALFRVRQRHPVGFNAFPHDVFALRERVEQAVKASRKHTVPETASRSSRSNIAPPCWISLPGPSKH